MEILIKAIAGSHLFGTNTSSSDTDYKGVYLPSGRDILLGEYPETIRTSTGADNAKNTSSDVDIELYSLTKFLKMLKNGDTAALELLFTPENMIIEKSVLWEQYIVPRKKELISTQIAAMVGYARQQANKYGIKGSRMGELNNIIIDLKKLESTLAFPDAKLKHAWVDIEENVIPKYKHIEIIQMQTGLKSELKSVPGIDILGKRFDYHCKFNYVMPILKKIYNNYGQRAREAKNNNGIDWKALSHAMRVTFQGIELLQTGNITLPLREDIKSLIKGIKLGLVDFNYVSETLESHLEYLEKARFNSSLQKEVSDNTIREITLKLHTCAVSLMGVSQYEEFL